MKMLRRYLTVMTLALTLCLAVNVLNARADDSRTIEDASAQEIVDGMANKLARGVTNVATGWLELPKQIYITSKDEGLAKGLLVGPIKGVGMTLVRTITGAGEALTFFIASPGFYSPYFDPSYVWQKE